MNAAKPRKKNTETDFQLDRFLWYALAKAKGESRVCKFTFTASNQGTIFSQHKVNI